MPRSSLSRRVEELERAIGIQLLYRTTRRVELTEAGEIYLVRAEQLVEDARIAHEDLRDKTDSPAGLVKISMPASIVWRLAMPWIREFLDLYTEVRIEVDTSPDHVDPVADKWDICLHDNAVRDSSLIVRQLASFRRALFASPSYLASRGAPQHPDDLPEHQCICAGPISSRALWKLSRGMERVEVAISGRVSCGNVEFPPLLALEGLGIAPAASSAYAGLVARGRLVKVLPDWQFEPLIISAITPTRQLPAKTRILLDFIGQKMKAVDLRIV